MCSPVLMLDPSGLQGNCQKRAAGGFWAGVQGFLKGSGNIALSTLVDVGAGPLGDLHLIPERMKMPFDVGQGSSETEITAYKWEEGLTLILGLFIPAGGEETVLSKATAGLAKVGRSAATRAITWRLESLTARAL